MSKKAKYHTVSNIMYNILYKINLVFIFSIASSFDDFSVDARFFGTFFNTGTGKFSFFNFCVSQNPLFL